MSTQTRKFKVGDLYVGDGKDLPPRTVLVDGDGDSTQKRVDGRWNRSYSDQNSVLTYAAGHDKRIAFLPEVKMPVVDQIISSPEEFEILPAKSVVLDTAGDSFQKATSGDVWFRPAHGARFRNADLPGTCDAPFRVLYVGKPE